MGQLKQSLVENISLQRCNCNIFGLTVTMVLFAKEAGFYRFWVFFRASSLQNKVGDPPFFYISDITNSSSFNGKISRKKSMLEKFGSNVLNWFFGEDWRIQRMMQTFQFSLRAAWTKIKNKHVHNYVTCWHYLMPFTVLTSLWCID